MSSTTFANGVTLTDEDWFNDTNTLVYGVFDEADNLASAHAAFYSATVGSAATFANLQALSFSASAGSANVFAIKDASISSVAGLAVATQAIMETASSTTTITPPGRLHFHPGVAKAWARFDGTATSVTAGASYGVTSITDNGTGSYTVIFSTAFSANAAYAPVVSSEIGRA